MVIRGVSETLIGTGIRNQNLRHQLVIATKVYGSTALVQTMKACRKHILSLWKLLIRLGTDYIDLYQAHSFDPTAPVEETLIAMDDLVHQGKVRYIGCSNYPAWRLTEALWTSELHKISRYETMQPHYNLVHRSEFERELADVCQKYGLGVLPYSPLAAGFLSNKYSRNQSEPESVRLNGVKRRYFNEKSWAVHEAVENLALIKEKTVSQIALAWLLGNLLITSPIIGPHDLEQLKDNLAAVEFRLSADEMKRLDDASSWQE
jgi:aryl-alcohol dehydrogenase-like predicted oxidoreductase